MNRYPFLPTLAALLAALLVSACSSEIPLLIRQGPVDSPAPALVREQVGDYVGRQVRWGGMLIGTENGADVTRLTVLAQPLGRDGEPGYDDDTSLGRFIAVVPAFLDPKVYTPDRLVTVTGTLRGSELGKVGEHPYRYPVVEAQAWHLWPGPAATPYGYPYPGWYDPWYGPGWYGPWYDPWYYPWYYPWYHPRDHDFAWRRLHPHPGMAPGPDAGPGPPEHRHRHPEPRHTRERPDTGAAPRRGHGATHPPRDHAVQRRHPGQREARGQPDAGAPRQRERSADIGRKDRSPEGRVQERSRGFQPEGRGFRLPFQRR